MSVEWCPTDKMTRDFLTKRKYEYSFKRFRDLIVGVMNHNLWPSYWASRINVWPEISCLIGPVILVELRYLCLLGSLLSPVLPGVLSCGRFPSSYWVGRINTPPIIKYSWRTGMMGEFGSPWLLGSFVLPFLSDVLTWVIFALSFSSIETMGGL